MPYVYNHINKNTKEVFYIGIAKDKKRPYSKKNRGKFWMDYTSKYDYDVIVTHSDICWEEACCIEKYLISFYGRRDLCLGNLVNMTDGGDGAINLSQDAKNRISETLKNNPSKPYLKLIEFNKTRQRIPCSEETKEKIRNAQKGKKRPEQSVINMRGKRKPLSEEHKQKIKESARLRKEKNVSVLNTYTLTAPATLALNGFTLTNP
jgi:hypothetical protein